MGEAVDRKPARPRFGWRAACHLLVWAVALVFAWKMARVTWAHAQSAAGIDFYFFWDAAATAVRGHAAEVYSAHASTAGMLEPLAHPPPFLLLVAPLALFGYGPALALWLALTGAAYLLTARQPARLGLANPAAAYNVLFGQTGFLTSTVLLGGPRLVDARPIAGGAVLGLMVMKPQLGLLLPFALVGSGKWRALAAAGASALLLAAAAAFAFGPGIYAAWWASLAGYAGWLQHGHWPWRMVASPYGFCRWAGVGNGAAFAAQLAISFAAAAVAFVSWRRDWSSKVAVLAAATLLASPYSFAYDAVPMIAPLGLLARRRPWQAALVWVLMFPPLLDTTFVHHAFVPFDTAALPNTIPFAAALSLFFLWKDPRRNSAATGEAGRA